VIHRRRAPAALPGHLDPRPHVSGGPAGSPVSRSSRAAGPASDDL